MSNQAFACYRLPSAQRLLVRFAVPLLLIVPGANGFAQDAARTIVKEDGEVRGRPTPRSVAFGLTGTDRFPPADRIEVAPLDVEALIAEDEAETESGPLRIGFMQDIPVVPDEAGVWTELPDGGWLWTVSFLAREAKGIQLRIRPWKPAVGAELIVFNPDRLEEAQGPFTRQYPPRREEFVTSSIFSDRLHLEYYLPPGAKRPEEGPPIEIDGVESHYRSMGKMFAKQVADALPCNLDVTCDSVWASVGRGVVWISTGCTGSLINRVSAAEDQTPLILTADHCPAGGTVYWFYQTDSCDGTPPDLATLPTSLAVTQLAEQVGTLTDIRLLGVSGDPPPGVRYLGWDSAPWNPPEGELVFGVHHPQGSFQRMTIGQMFSTSLAPGCPMDYWAVALDGWWEPGSSGSPVFSALGQIRGVVSCGYERNTSCEDTLAWIIPASFSHAYFRVNDDYPNLRAYLDPTDPVYVDSANAHPLWLNGTGTSENPFAEFEQGVFAVIEGSTVHIEGGHYDGNLTITKGMTLRASGPGDVVLGKCCAPSGSIVDDGGAEEAEDHGDVLDIRN